MDSIESNGTWVVAALPPEDALRVAVLLGKQGDCYSAIGEADEAARKYRLSLKVLEGREETDAMHEVGGVVPHCLLCWGGYSGTPDVERSAVYG